jgi:endogenous inhibitor of DNA gyrase (YacG/DUF329 family)
MAKTVACPTCGTGIEWNPENRFRPFCSERCKMVDLGAWATERYRVPVVETDELEVPDEGDSSPKPN